MLVGIFLRKEKMVTGKFLAMLMLVIGVAGQALAGGHLENEKTPEKFLQYYFDAFNAEDAKTLDTVFAKPFQRISNGQTVSYASWEEYIDFDLIKKTGWKRSVINETQIIYQGDKSAIMRVVFSRLDASDNIVAKAEAAMVLVKPKSQWKLATAILPGSIPINDDK
jgi:hypothetical protein